MAYRNPQPGGKSNTPLILGGVGLVAVGAALFLFRGTIFGGNGGSDVPTQPPAPTGISAAEAVAIGTERVLASYPPATNTFFGPTRNLKKTGKPSGMSQVAWDGISSFGGNTFWYTEFKLRDESTFTEFRVHTVIDAFTGAIVRFGFGTLSQNLGL